jgi:hypothetical protein
MNIDYDPVEVKMNFSRTISNAAGDNYNHGDCFYFGIMSGCHDNCPVYQRGECKNGYDGE